MNKFIINAMAAAIALAFGAGALAENMSKDQYGTGKDAIAAEFKAAMAACGTLAGNANDICKAEASGSEKVARAELDAKYKPSNDATYKVSVAKAKAAYAAAKEKCDDKAGNQKDVCVKEAKAAETAAIADAKSSMKTSDANQAAREKTVAANAIAGEKSTAARKDAAADKRNADYAVAKEKCDKFADDAKTSCVSEAKARFGQS